MTGVEQLILYHLPVGGRELLPGLWLIPWWEWHVGGDGWFGVKSAYWWCSWRWPRWLGG